eukprot:6604241-Prymnesium_polylepis.2
MDAASGDGLVAAVAVMCALGRTVAVVRGAAVVERTETVVRGAAVKAAAPATTRRSKAHRIATSSDEIRLRARLLPSRRRAISDAVK